MSNNRLPINALRAMSNLSQAQLAEKVGVDRATIASWEKYKTYPDVPHLILLAGALGCGVDDIFFPVYAS